MSTAPQATASDESTSLPMMETTPDGAIRTTDIIIDLSLRGMLAVVRGAIAAPVQRILMLTACEGELVRQGRLPTQGFGGIWACVRHVWQKEGAMGFLRGALVDVALELPCGIATVLATNLAFSLVKTGFPAEMTTVGTASYHLVFSLLAMPLSVLLATPMNAIRKCVVTNYIADIVAPDRRVPKMVKKCEKEPATAKGTPSEEDDYLGEAYRFSSATETARCIYRRHGLRGFYRGSLIDPLTMLSYRGTCMCLLLASSPDLISAYYYPFTRALEVLADFVTCPLEVIGRRMALTASVEDESCPPYSGILDCAQRIVKEEGVSALWSGMKFRVQLTCFSIALHILFG